MRAGATNIMFWGSYSGGMREHVKCTTNLQDLLCGRVRVDPKHTTLVLVTVPWQSARRQAIQPFSGNRGLAEYARTQNIKIFGNFFLADRALTQRVQHFLRSNV